MKVVVNRCFGGFGLSVKAYEWLIANGIPVKKYVKPKRDELTGCYEREPDERCVYDHNLDDEPAPWVSLVGRYWDTWIRRDRSDELLVRCVEELGSEMASGRFGELEVVEIPDGVEYIIEEYDGKEHVAEAHRTW